MEDEKLDVVILAAGYSTRLYPLTKNFPKPLLEVGEKPVITNIVEKLENLKEIGNVYVITNDKFYKHFLNWEKNLKTTLDIVVISDGTSSEKDKLGAMGDVNFVIKEKSINRPLFIIGGDNLFDFGLRDMVNYFKEKNKDVVCASEIKELSRLKNMGVAKLDKNNKIIFLEEKPENPPSRLAVSCMYLYTKETTSLIKKYLEDGNNPDNTGSFLQWLYPRKEVYAFINKGKIIDIGTPETLEKARKEFIFSSCS